MSEAEPHEIVRYLRECYRENGARSGLWNFYGNSVHNRLFVEGDTDLALEDLDLVGGYYLNGAAAAKCAKQSQLYRKERDLLYGSVFVVGWVERIEGNPEVICAPVFLYPASLTPYETEEGAELEITRAEGQLNAAVLEAIGGEEFLRKIESATEQSQLSEGCVGTVRQEFAKNFPDAETESLLSYPQLVKGRELKQIFDRVSEDDQSPLVLVPAAAVALVNKSQQMRGVLNELEEMGGKGTLFSPPLRAILNGADTVFQPDAAGCIPAHLSEAQKKVVESSRHHPLTVAIGPPGTGKSFTIAALAIEAVSRGKSVIIASKMDHAVDVAGDKIEATLGLEGVVTRGGRKDYLRKLKKYIEELLSGIHTADSPLEAEVENVRKALKRAGKVILNSRDALVKRTDLEIKWGQLIVKNPASWFTRWRQQRIQKKLEKAKPLQELGEAVYDKTEWEIKKSLQYLQLQRKYLLNSALESNRTSFQKYDRAIRSRTGGKQEEYFDSTNWEAILQAFPVWLVNLSDVHKILPLLPGQFDLAIIDEASQCDIASALPVLQRANRAVIAGDPKQLRHLSFLPNQRQKEMSQEFGLSEEQTTQFDFREVSLLDLVSDRISDQSRIAFLNEHFRSRPEIIQFSNREFYAGQLSVMTGNHDCVHRRSDMGPPLKTTQLADGERAGNGVNEAEAEAILEEAVKISQHWDDRLGSKSESPVTIGILSPFRNQVDLLKREVTKITDGHRLLNHNQLLIGTAHTFQGEERDVMLISLALDDKSPSASFRFLDKPDLFNVAVTRARQVNHIFYSFDPGKVREGSLVGKYLAFAHEIERNTLKPESGSVSPVQVNRDQFANEVAEFLRDSGADVSIGYPLAGTTIDLMFTIEGRSFGIDLVGFPGDYADAFPLERILTFQRAGLKIYPIAYSAWYFQRHLCEYWLKNLIDKEKEQKTVA